MKVAEVGRERVETVEDVRGVEDGGAAGFGLLSEEGEEAGAHEDV